MWLLERLDVARRGADLLERKRQALLREHARARAEAQEALCAWRDACTQAQQWSERALTLDGAGRLVVLHQMLDIDRCRSGISGG